MTGIGNKWLVLLLDDQFDNIAVAKTALEFHGATVHVARHGEEGLALLNTLMPTVILMDLNMPVLDGWKTYDRIRTNRKFDHVPIIAVTAYAMEGDRERVLDYGFDEHIAKPYDIHQLIDNINLIVERKKDEIRNG